VDRRSLITLPLLALTGRLVPGWTSRAEAQQASPAWRHGLSPFGDLKYPPGFKKFDYVNANAPKGGVARQSANATYDSFNTVVAGVKGTLVAGIDLIYDTLMVPALDEVSSQYGLIAEAVSHPADLSTATFRLRPEAKWHDGTPVTPDDVVFSFDAFKTKSPQGASDYSQVVKAEKTGDREVTFTFDGPGHRDVLQILGQLAILPKAWWEGTNADGKKRDIGSTTLEPPLGSGPYRIKEFSPGRNIVYERVKDYWGSNLNVNVGRDNFDELRFEYFRDPTAAIEAFKAGIVDWRIENSAKSWATAYDFQAVTDGRVILQEFPINNVGLMQAFAFNIRRAKFKDPRVRLAFNYAFDFESLNKQTFFGQYTRIASYFEGTDLAATGLPGGRELEILETVRGRVPAQVFTTAYSNPVCDNPDAVRRNIREAVRLLKEAGYEVHDQQVVNSKTGEPFTVEFLSNSPLFERIYFFYKTSLERLGITVSVRSVDEAQYENRLRSWDFDIITYAWGQSLLPGSELRGFWGSQSAAQDGSSNVVGIENPAVDALIQHVVGAKNREELVAAVKALDRVMLWNHYVVPQWHYGKLRCPRWDLFAYSEPLPRYGMAAFPALWWWDADRAAKAANRT
jgi:microcin C transport system substrate-binding protein